MDYSSYLQRQFCCTYKCCSSSESVNQTSNSLNSLQYTVSLEQSGGGTEFVLAGILPDTNNNIIATNQISSYITPFEVYNNHVLIKVNSIVAGNSSALSQIRVQGTSISESTAIPIKNDTETLTFKASAGKSYQTIKKWLKVTAIDIVSNITSINYDIAVLGYVDFLNAKVEIIGYRAEILGDENGYNSDITVQLYSVKQNGVETSIVPIENITINSPKNEIVDNIRVGQFNRSYIEDVTSLHLWPENVNFVVKQSDFSSYFSNEENVVDGVKNEGIMARLRSTNLGPPNGPRHAALQIYYKYI